MSSMVEAPLLIQATSSGPVAGDAEDPASRSGKPLTAAIRANGAATGGPQVVTMGCRLNAYESEVIRAHASAAGLNDAVIINTCAVTGEAMRQAAQTIRRLKRERPGARVIVTGCGAQLEPAKFAMMDEVDHVIGNAEKMRAETFLTIARLSGPVRSARRQWEPPESGDGSAPGSGAADHAVSRVHVADIMRVRETASHMLDGFTGRARASVEIQNGCDHRCTFCIIPFARGPSRSHSPDAVVARVRAYVADGYNEVVLTGVDITSYGADLPERPTLGLLVQQILREVPELPRLRLTSIDQVEADDALFEAIATESRLMPHLHLSLQSGDDLILKRMKRRHQRADAVRFCDRVRAVRPDIVFGADVIAGFPTETETAFQNSLSMIGECGITYVHAFPYSPRPGTPAARMPQAGRAVAKERAQRLREAGDLRHASFLSGLVGSVQTIVAEAGNVGRTPQYAEVRYDPARFDGTSADVSRGAIVPLRIAAASPGFLSGVPA